MTSSSLLVISQLQNNTQLMRLLSSKDKHMFQRISPNTSALQMRIRRIRVQGDSKLGIKQVDGEFALKEIALMFYRTAIRSLSDPFLI